MTSPYSPVNRAKLEKYFYVPIVRRTFDPRGASPLVSTDIRDPRTNKYYDLGTIWYNTKDVRFFILAEIDGTGKWLMFAGGGGGAVTSLRADDGNTANPNLGIIDIFGNVVAFGTHAKPLFSRADVANTVNLDMQIADTVTPTPGDALNCGVSCYNENHFSIDPTSGMVSLSGGGAAIDQVMVDFNTVPGTNPVDPDGNGLITVNGNVVANATNANAPIATHSRALNTFDIDQQVASAVVASPGDAFDAGIASFDAAAFTCNTTTGFVQLIGGGQAMTSIGVDFDTAPGTDPVVPNGSGVIDIIGNVVANGTNAGFPVATHSRAANQLNIDTQVSTALASAPGDKLDAGLASFDSGKFTVDSDGFVEIKEQLAVGAYGLGITYDSGSGLFSITRDDGTALSSTNKGLVVIPSNVTVGTNITTEITANQTFTDANGTSTIVGNTFGTDAGVAWTNDIPFFIYACMKDDDSEVTFAISRRRESKQTVSAADMGKDGTATADKGKSFFFLDDPTLADYAVENCICIGEFRMRKDSSDDWTIQTFFPRTSALYGANTVRYTDESFNFSTGLLGAASGTYFKDNGGTAPATSGASTYNWRDAQTIHWRAGLTITSSGVGAVAAQLVPPFPIQRIVSAQCYINDSGTISILEPLNFTSYVEFIYLSSSASGSLLNTDVTMNQSFVVRINYDTSGF